jgi:cytochrome c2
MTIAARLISCLLLLLAAAPVSAFAFQLPDAPEGFEVEAELYALRCLACHSIGQGEWVGPDLIGIERRRDRAWLRGFLLETDRYLDEDPFGRELLAQHSGVRMPQAEIFEHQIDGLLDYIAALDHPRPDRPEQAARKPPAVAAIREPGGGWTPAWGLVVVVFIAAGALGRTKRWKSAQVAGSLSVGLIYLAVAGVERRGAGEPVGASDRPIAFSHALHAGEMSISCLYCHSGAEQAEAAGLPPLSTCMNCHEIVRKRTSQIGPSPDLAKLVAAWESRQGGAPATLQWRPRLDSPESSGFSHAGHSSAGFSCQDCHGAVETMERIESASSVTRKTCAECH